MISPRFLPLPALTGIAYPALGEVQLAVALFHLGILDLSECSVPSLRSFSAEARLRQEGVEIPAEAVLALRAASVHGCDVMANHAQAQGDSWVRDVSAVGLSAWFSMEDEKRRESLPGLVDTTSVFF